MSVWLMVEADGRICHVLGDWKVEDVEWVVWVEIRLV